MPYAFSPSKTLIVTIAAGTLLIGCRQRVDDTSSEKDFSKGGFASFYVAEATGGDLDFYQLSADNEVVQPKVKTHSVPYKQSGGLVFASLGGLQLAKNPDVNYGYISEPLWSCADAKKLVNESASVGATDKCRIVLDTEDQSWYTISVFNLGPNGTAKHVYTPNRALANLKTVTHPLANGPLAPPKDINVLVDEAPVLAAMLALQTKYKSNTTGIEARNSCLKNGRAQNWLDLQAHYYCNLPYTTHRKCYSESLIALTAPLAALTDARQKVGGLLKAYNDSFDKCFSATGSYPMTAPEAAAFKYIMFVKTGLMDFNIESSNRVINKFYGSIAKRPRRVTDTYPLWQENQERYDVIREKQKKAIGP